MNKYGSLLHCNWLLIFSNKLVNFTADQNAKLVYIVQKKNIVQSEFRLKYSNELYLNSKLKP